MQKPLVNETLSHLAYAVGHQIGVASRPHTMASLRATGQRVMVATSAWASELAKMIARNPDPKAIKIGRVQAEASGDPIEAAMRAWELLERPVYYVRDGHADITVTLAEYNYLAAHGATVVP